MSYFNNIVKFTNPRWWVFSRVMAAIFAGYALAITGALFIEQLLTPMLGKYQALHIGLMLGFLIYACTAMWIFSVASAKRAWLGVITVNVILLILIWLLIQVNA